jgi:hypothetical protein
VNVRSSGAEIAIPHIGALAPPNLVLPLLKGNLPGSKPRAALEITIVRIAPQTCRIPNPQHRSQTSIFCAKPLAFFLCRSEALFGIVPARHFLARPNTRTATKKPSLQVLIILNFYLRILKWCIYLEISIPWLGTQPGISQQW